MGYNVTGRFWLIFILTICVLCTIGCGGGTDDAEDNMPQMCDTRPTPQTVGPYQIVPCPAQ